MQEFKYGIQWYIYVEQSKMIYCGCRPVYCHDKMNKLSCRHISVFPTTCIMIFFTLNRSTCSAPPADITKESQSQLSVQIGSMRLAAVLQAEPRHYTRWPKSQHIEHGVKPHETVSSFRFGLPAYISQKKVYLVAGKGAHSESSFLFATSGCKVWGMHWVSTHGEQTNCCRGDVATSNV